MDEPNRIERLVGEIVGLRILVAALVEKQGGMETMRDAVMQELHSYEVRSDTTDGAERIKACGENMLRNFPNLMDEKIT